MTEEEFENFAFTPAAKVACKESDYGTKQIIGIKEGEFLATLPFRNIEAIKHFRDQLTKFLS